MANRLESYLATAGYEGKELLFSCGIVFAYTGRMNNGAMGNTSNGYWWSRTANDSTNAYILNINSSNVNPGTTNGNRNNGFAVRCVARSDPRKNHNYN